MATDLRGAVRDSARYLRSVRPLDPDELAEYVEGGAHPAVVTRILREEAFDLGLVERADGAFVPIPEGPLAPDFDGVGGFPAVYDDRLEDALVDAFGPDWATGETGNRLRNRLQSVKAAYFAGEAVEYDRETALVYAVYHLADFYAATQYVLHELGGDGLLGRRLRVLDVGAGTGGPALGVHDYCLGAPDEGGAAGATDDAAADAATPPCRIAYDALEPGAGRELLESLLAETGPNFETTVSDERVEAFEPDGGDGDSGDSGESGDDGPAYDLILFGNVLSELAAPVAELRRALDWLAEDGTVVLTAPADLETATQLRACERELVRSGDATVYAPTAWLWADRHPTDRGWSFDRRPDVAPPGTMATLAEAGDHPEDVLNTDVKHAYSLLRTDGRRRHDVTLSRGRAMPLGEAERAVTERVDLVASKLSADLSVTARPGGGGDVSGGRSAGAAADGDRDADRRNPVFKIGDGSEQTECYAVQVNETVLNEGLAAAGYGAIVAIENGLVLWNDDEGAYNVVVDEETVVDVVGRGAETFGRD